MKRFLVMWLGIIMAVCAFFVPPFYVSYAQDAELVIHFIDVGQGDACIVELPGDKTMLIDAGEKENAVADKIDGYITENIKDDNGKTIEYFDYVVMTHSDSDHIGSMDKILEKYHAKMLYRPNQVCEYRECVDHAFDGKEERNRFWQAPGSKDTATYHRALEAAYEYSDEVIVTNPYDETQNKIETGGCVINFYSPLSSSYSDNNNYSPIMIIEYMGVNIVLTGDAESKNESEFVEAVRSGVGRYAALQNFSADVIKLGHHGSRTSSSEDYLDIVTRESSRNGVFVVISCGEGNKYDHPHDEVLNRLQKFGFNNERILRTDKVGDIVISVDESDGEYVAKYGDLKSETGNKTGNGEKEQDIVSFLISSFNELNIYAKIVLIVIIIVIIAVAIVILCNSRKKHRRKRR